LQLTKLSFGKRIKKFGGTFAFLGLRACISTLGLKLADEIGVFLAWSHDHDIISSNDNISRLDLLINK
jgi:hypothetical protein